MDMMDGAFAYRESNHLLKQADPVRVRFYRNDGVDTGTKDVLTDWKSARTLQPGRIMCASYDY